MEDTGHVKTIGDALRHRGAMLIAVLAAFLLAAAGLWLITPRVYESEAILYIDVRWNVPQSYDTAVQASEHLARYHVEQATSRPVLQRVIGDLALATPPEKLRKRITARIVKGTSLVAVRAQSSTAEKAAGLANSVAQALVAQNRSDIGERLRATRQYLERELQRLETAIQEVQKTSPPANNAAAASDRQAQLALLHGEYATTYARLQEVALAQARGTDALSVAQEAAAPAQPASPDLVLYLLVALASGSILGLAGILLLERFDDRLFDAESLARATGTALVVSLPSRGSARGQAPTADPYLLARTTLRARYPEAHVLMMAAASERDEADAVAARFGAVAAQAGERVLVVPTGGGSDAPPLPASHNGESRATVLPAISVEGARTALESMANGRRAYDLAVLSAASPDRSPMALSLAPCTDLAMLVATAGRTRFAEAARTAESLRRAGIEVVGSLLLPERAPRD